jgi:O-antigen/teichoic acid export membrane protein
MILQKVALNTLWQIIGKVVSIATGIAVITLLTRSLGAEGYGGFTTVTAYLQFFGIIVDFGLTLIAVQMLSTDKWNEKKLFDNFMSLKVGTSLIIFGLAVAIAWITNYPQIVKLAITIASVSFFLNTIQQVYVGWYQKYLMIAKLAIAEVLSKFVLLGGVIYIVFSGGGLIELMPVLIAASATYLFFSLFFIRDRYRIGFAYDTDIIKEILRRSWPIALGIIFNLIYLKADTIILSLTRSQAEVGIYGASFRILEVLITIPMMILGLLLPQFTRAWATDDHSYFKILYQKTYDLIHIIVWPIALGGIVIATPLILFIAGDEFTASIPILQILLLALVAIFLSTLFGHLIVSMNRQKQAVWSYAVSAFLALLFYLLVIPIFGFWGAALITLAAEIGITALLYIIVGKETGIWPQQLFAASALGSALGMYALLMLIELHLFIEIGIGLFVYPIFLLLLLHKSPKNVINYFKF